MFGNREETGKKAVTTAVVLAAGQGRRMESSIQKQYMKLGDKPLIFYALNAFEKSPVDRIILVVGQGEKDYCRREIIERYGFTKVDCIVEGGKERYHSVYEGLKAAVSSDYVLIHDGARPCVSDRVIRAAIEGAVKYRACVVGMPVKDTIKIADDGEFTAATPDRSKLWAIQTPQAFAYELILSAYKRLFESPEYQTAVTDDAMVVEQMTDDRVKLIAGAYSNIKVTTPEDIALAEALLKHGGMLI